MQRLTKGLGLCSLVLCTPATLYADQTEIKFTKPSSSPAQSYEASANVFFLADPLFADLAALEAGLEADLYDELLDIEELKSISTADVNIDALTATFTGTGPAEVLLTLSGIDLVAAGRFDGIDILCPTVKATVKLEQLQALATYDFYTGAIKSLGIDYHNDVSLSCSGGILSFPGVSDLVSLFAEDYAESWAHGKLEDLVEKYTDILNMKDLFGVAEILEDPEVSDAIDAIETAFDFDFRDAVNNLFTGVNIKLGVYRNRNGAGQHLIHFDVHQTAPTITSIGGGNFTVSAPGSTDFVRYLYANGSWVESTWPAGLLKTGDRIGVLAFNDYYDLPSYFVSTTLSLGNCGKACE